MPNPPVVPAVRRQVSLARLVVCASLGVACGAHAESQFLKNGAAGFVVSDIKYALAPDADKSGACPRGMSKNVVEIYGMTPNGKRRKGETEGDFSKRLEREAGELVKASDGKNLCMNPEAGSPDPHFQTVQRSDMPVDGIDLDGNDSNGAPTSGMCPHQDFVSLTGERGVDNQFYRVVGCSRSFQSNGMSNGFATEMLTGSWGILLTLNGVDDLRNDDSVEVGLFANADPIQLSPNREVLGFATYAIDQDPRFRARTRGRIKDGVLTTDPVDVRFHHVVNSLRLERPLRHAVLRATISEAGVLEGYLGGYAPVEEMYDVQFGFRNGKKGADELGPLALRMHTGVGAARVLGYTCPGVYYSLYKYADGDPDPQSGRCTSISVQYRIKAINAFVVDVATESVNRKLTQSAPSHEK
jgi:hypothetical protein